MRFLWLGALPARIVGAVSAIAAMAIPLPAQELVPATEFPLRLSQVEIMPDAKSFAYAYRLDHRGADDDVLDHILIDLSTPPRAEPLVVLRPEPNFLFDAVAERSDTTVWHPPVAIRTPENWWSSIHVGAALSWRAEQRGAGPSHGVHLGESRDGLALESTAWPAYRRARVSRAVPFRDVDDTTTTAPPRAFYDGFVLAPGRLPDQVDLAYFEEQVEGACWMGAVSDCNTVRSLVARIRQAHEANAPGLLRAAVTAFDSEMQANADKVGQTVLRYAVRALAKNFPDRR